MSPGGCLLNPPTLDTMEGIGSVYAAGRGRIGDLVVSLDAEQAAIPVPACPAWTVHDVVAHVTGVCTDILSGNIEGVTTDPWTAAQVDARKDVPIAEVVAEWNEAAAQVEAFAENFPERVDEQWVADLTTHEHDIRGALGQPGGRDTDALHVGLDFLVTMGLASSLSSRQLPGLRVTAGEKSWVVAGDDAGNEACDEVQAPAFELFRALTGRRSPTQIRGYAWTGAPDRYLPAFEYGPFTVRPTDLVE